MTPRPIARRALRSGVVGAAMVFALVGCGVNLGSSGSSSDQSQLGKFYGQSLTWTACEGELQCASFDAPLNYAEPDGSTVTIKMLKSPAKDPTKRLGSLVVNPGGPGGSGYEFAQYASGTISPAVMAQYDVVGFDPRGVARSTPIKCLDGPETDKFISTLGAPANAEQQRRVEQVSKGLGTNCQAKSPALTPQIGTVAAARDLDILRNLLREEQLNFLGISYGTFLGLTYADLFSDRVGKFVLDGVIDPALSNSELARGQADGFQVELSRFIADCPAHPDCPLPAEKSAGLAKINSWLASIAMSPIRAEPDRPLNRPLAVNGIVSSLYSEDDGWPQLRVALAAGFQGNGKPMLEMVDSFTGRQADGSYRDNAIDALYGITCLDRPDHDDAAATEELATDWSRTAPTFGPELAWGNLPCSTWPAPATLDPHPVTVSTAQPVLLIGTRYDPATPYVWAESVSKQLPNNRLLTYEDDGHTGYGDNSCVNAAVDGFLITGQPPATGATCTPEKVQKQA